MQTDDLKVKIKHFFSNPNTRTFIFVILLIVIVYIVYNSLVQRSIEPTSIPYANVNISGQTEITPEMLSMVEISGSFLTNTNGNLIQQRAQAIGHRVKLGYNILKDSFIYNDAIEAEANTERETDFKNIPDGYTIYSMKVDFHSTYGCSIMPGNYIDLYMKANDGGKTIFQLFIKSIQVAKVLDGSYNDVFKDLESTSCSPAHIYFIVPIEYFELLRKAEMISNYGFQLIIVPRNSGYSENPEETTIASEELENLILSRSAVVSY